MRPASRCSFRGTSWKPWLDRIAVAWIVLAPLGALVAWGVDRLPGERAVLAETSEEMAGEDDPLAADLRRVRAPGPPERFAAP
jgi:hypothetical protein